VQGLSTLSSSLLRDSLVQQSYIVSPHYLHAPDDEVARDMMLVLCHDDLDILLPLIVKGWTMHKDEQGT